MMWNLITGVIVLVIFIFGFCFGFLKVVHEKEVTSLFSTLERRNLGRVSTPQNNERIPERLSESRRRNAVQESGSAEDDTSSMKSINLPSYEDLQPPSYDVAVHL
ncbi:hypothetical protein TNIN_455901 [Trichonephila inaurata madagascariensis]|uniref:Uncharacterized protein n=1 Tax=Trichonephila inaurata madagascariensis TaxID=2747483 RepID=A0A8X6XVH0_9ARAC|nr:hypothetical protein TNIN_455901 [Trichonephila inaurata madagascariensis]